MAESGVLIYTHPECTICVSVKMELDEKGKVYEEIDLGDHPRGGPSCRSLPEATRSRRGGRGR